MAIYQLKKRPEDFIVDEVMELKLEGGPFAIFKLKKRNLNTADAIKKVAIHLGISSNRIGFAGLKDKKAVTTQYCSVDLSKDQLNWSTEDLSIEYVGQEQERMYLGRNKGNAFTITVRKVTKKPKPLNVSLNLFGQQRFGTQNIDVGRALVKGQFEQVCKMLHIKDSSTNALRKYGAKRLKFYVNAYQSWLWNQWVKRKDPLPEELPLPGFNVEADDILKEIFEKESIDNRMFIIRAFPTISGEPILRKTKIPVTCLTVGELEDDELNPGFKKILVSFELPKGCYATVFIHQLVTQRE